MAKCKPFTTNGTDKEPMLPSGQAVPLTLYLKDTAFPLDLGVSACHLKQILGGRKKMGIMTNKTLVKSR